jgi:hypothetical protein
MQARCMHDRAFHVEKIELFQKVWTPHHYRKYSLMQKFVTFQVIARGNYGQVNVN